jgi:hypothetical protein
VDEQGVVSKPFELDPRGGQGVALTLKKEDSAGVVGGTVLIVLGVPIAAIGLLVTGAGIALCTSNTCDAPGMLVVTAGVAAIGGALIWGGIAMTNSSSQHVDQQPMSSPSASAPAATSSVPPTWHEGKPFEGAYDRDRFLLRLVDVSF